MIKCPKCNFEQPEDIYCAQCGVNMKTFVPPKKSVLISLFTNQGLIVGLLFVGIVIFVVYDYALSKKPKSVTVAAVTKQTSEQIDLPDGDTPSDYQASQQSDAQSPAPPVEEATPQANTANEVVTAGPQMKATVAASRSVKAESLQISFYQATRSLLAELQRESNASPFSGDGFGGILSKKRLAVLRKSPELKPVSSNRYKLDGHAISIFKGQRSGESAKSIGLYFQINPLRNDPSGTQIEVKSWGSLKAQGTDESFFTSEMTLNSQSTAIIAGFLPKDKVFGDEEKAIFESDRALKIYNMEDFWDGDIDLIMFVELPD